MDYPRTISIVAVIDKKKDLKKAEWIWNIHAKKENKHGIRITHIGSGNLFDQLDEKDELQQKLNEAKEIGKWYNEDRENKIQLLEDRIVELEKEIKVKNENT